MGFRKPSAAQVGVAFVLIGVCLFVGWKWWLDTRIWVPLNVPISLSRGQIQTPEFWTNVDSSYLVYIEVDQKHDFRRIRCFLGRSFYETCENSPTILKASWSLSAGGKVLASGNSNDGQMVIGVGTLGHGLGAFTAEKGTRYVLDLHVEDNAERLNPYNPRLKVEEQGGIYQSAIDNAAFVFLLATLLALLGTGILVRFGLRWRRERYAKAISLAFMGPIKSDHLCFDPGLRIRSQIRQIATRGSFSVWLGIVLIVIGICSYAYIEHRMSTRTFTVVDMPVSLARGHIRTGPFRTNLEASYSIEFHFDQEQKFADDCAPYSVLQTNWAVYRDGKLVDEVTEETLNGAYLGQFESLEGTYDLDVNVLQDASCLDSGHPKLLVRSKDRDYADAASRRMWSLALCVVVGITLLIIPRVGVLGKQFDPPLSLTGSETIGQNFQWAQRLPLRRRISGLPSFGLVGALVFFVSMISMWMASAPTFHSQGLFVRLLTPQVVAKVNSWTNPVIVRIADIGPNAIPNLYVDSKLVAWNDLDAVLKQELGRRPSIDWVVYLEADSNVEYEKAVLVIDVIRNDQAQVVILTPKSKIR